MSSPDPDVAAGHVSAPSADTRRPPEWVVVVALFLGFSGLYLATAIYDVTQVNDTRSVANAAWSLGTQGTLQFPVEWEEHPGPLTENWGVEGADGRYYSNRFPGAIWLTAPFYWVADLFTDIGEDVWHPWLVSVVPATVAAALVTAAALAATYLLLRRLADRRLAILATLVLGLGTSAWSVSSTAMWTHGPGHLFLVLGMLAASSERFGRAGLAHAAAMVTRPQLGVVTAVTGLYRLVSRRTVGDVARFWAVAALGVVVMVLYSRAVFGEVAPTAGYGSGPLERATSLRLVPYAREFLLSLFSPTRGLLVYSAFIVLLLPGLGRAWRDSPEWVRGSALAGCAYLLLQLRLNGYDGGTGFFGYRVQIESLVLAWPLLLRSYQVWAAPILRRRALVGAACLLSLAVFAYGAWVTHSDVLRDPAMKEFARDLADQGPEGEAAQVSRDLPAWGGVTATGPPDPPRA